MADEMVFIPMRYRVDLDRTINTTPLNTLFAMGDAQAHRFELTITHGIEAEDLTGCTVNGKFVSFSNNMTVNLTGSVTGGNAVVTLTQACYAQLGRFALVIQIVKGSVKTSVFYGDGYMRSTTTDNAIDGNYIVYDTNVLLSKIQEIENAITGANAAIANANAAAEHVDANMDAKITARVDKTLSVEDGIADAKKVGEEIGSLKSEMFQYVKSIGKELNLSFLVCNLGGLNGSGAETRNDARIRTNVLSVNGFIDIRVKSGYSLMPWIYDINMNLLTYANITKTTITSDEILAIKNNAVFVRFVLKKDDSSSLTYDDVSESNICVRFKEKTYLTEIIERYNKRNNADSYIFKARLSNPSPCNYNNYPIKLMVNFDKGVCQDENCIMLYKSDGTELPFDFYPCYDENLLVANNYTLYNDGSIKCGYLVFVDTILNGYTNEYNVEIRPNRIERNWEKKVTWNKFGDNTLRSSKLNIVFAPNNAYRMMYLNNNEHHIDYYFKDELNVSKNEAQSDFVSSFVEDYEMEIIGSGYASLCLHRKLNFVDRIFEQWITVYANGKYEAKNSIMFLLNSETKQHTIRHVFYCDAEQTTIENKKAKCYTSTLNGKRFMTSLVYLNGNSQRDDQNKPIYIPTVSATTNTTRFDLLAQVSLSNTSEFKKGYVFTSCIAYQTDGNDNDIYRLFNNLNSAVATNHIGEAKRRLSENIKDFGVFALDCFKSTYQTSDYQREYVDPFIALFEYINNVGTIDKAEKSFDKLVNSKFNGVMNIQNINGVYEKVGFEFVGRCCPVAYYLYKITGKEKYLNAITEYAEFVADVIMTKNDMPLHKNGNANSNSRCSALYALALGLEVSDNEKYENAWHILKPIIDNEICLGTIQLEGDIITSRYLHYTMFANYYYMLAMKHHGTSGMNSLYNYALDSTLPSGEIKDLTYCQSDSRRGKAHTYAYVLGILALSEDYSAINQANHVAKWLSSQMPITGVYPNMLDGYTTYESGISSVGFAISAMAETVMTLMWSLKN